MPLMAGYLVGREPPREEIVASEALLERLGVPAFFREHLAASWRRREPHLYGRLDLA